MIKRSQINRGKLAARLLLENAGVCVSPSEFDSIEVADFGLENYPEEGSQIITFVNTDRVGFKVICLLPRQTLPEHWHTSFDDNPGKEETLRVLFGTVYLGVMGDDNLSGEAMARKKPDCYECRHMLTMNAPEQITFAPGEKHWLQAGENGCVIYSISSAARCALDPFTDRRVKRVVEIFEDM